MAKPTDDEIVAALQEAGSNGMTIAAIGRLFGVPWQSLTKQLHRLDANDERNRRAWCDWSATRPPIWRAIGFTTTGGAAKVWSDDAGGWVAA